MFMFVLTGITDLWQPCVFSNVAFMILRCRFSFSAYTLYVSPPYWVETWLKVDASVRRSCCRLPWVFSSSVIVNIIHHHHYLSVVVVVVRPSGVPSSSSSSLSWLSLVALATIKVHHNCSSSVKTGTRLGGRRRRSVVDFVNDRSVRVRPLSSSLSSSSRRPLRRPPLVPCRRRVVALLALDVVT